MRPFKISNKGQNALKESQYQQLQSVEVDTISVLTSVDSFQSKEGKTDLLIRFICSVLKSVFTRPLPANSVQHYTKQAVNGLGSDSIAGGESKSISIMGKI